MVAVMVGTLVVLVVGAYVFIRILASVINSRRDNWESAGASIGLSVDPTSLPIQKDLLGELEGRKFRVSRYTVPRGESSYDDHVAVEFPIDTLLPFSFRVERTELLYQKVTNMFSNDDIGHKAFDKVFRVKASNMVQLGEFLNIEVPDGETPTILNDLMIAQKSHFRVIATEGSICLGRKSEHRGDAETIQLTMKRAAYLAARFEHAAKIYSNESSDVAGRQPSI